MGFSVGGSVGGLVSGGSVGFVGDVGLGSVGGCGGASCVGRVVSSANGVCVSGGGFAGTVSSVLSGPSASSENVAVAGISYTVFSVACSVSSHTIMCVSSVALETAVRGCDSEVEMVTAPVEHPTRNTAVRMEAVNALFFLMGEPPLHDLAIFLQFFQNDARMRSQKQC